MESNKEKPNTPNTDYEKWQDAMSDVEEPDKHIEPIEGPLAKWTEGLDLTARQPYPFDCNVDEDFYDEEELKEVLADKSTEEAKQIIKKNQEAIIRNNEEIDKLNSRILEIYEMSPEEKEALYNNEKTSKSDKSLLACVEFCDMPTAEYCELSSRDKELVSGIRKATDYLYGFGVIQARSQLREAGSHFTILTKKEREAVGEGSLEDIASAALESFVMSPFYDTRTQIKEYDDFLYGVMLDCTKRKVVDTNGAKTIKETVDLEEFQARATESMTNWFFEEGLDKVYRYSDYRDVILRRTSELNADQKTGHHFESDQISKFRGILVEPPSSSEIEEIGYSVLSFPDDDYDDIKNRDKYDANFNKRVRKNNRAVFHYNKELARTEMEPWANKIDLERIESINNSAEPLEEKVRKVIEYIQQAFEITNDDWGKSQPIELKWFRYKTPLTTIKKLLHGKVENDIIMEKDLLMGGYYCDGSVNLPVTMKKQKKLSSDNVNTIVHEMWHAKQDDMRQQSRMTAGSSYYNHDMKTRMYAKNNLAKVDVVGHYSQIKEREAYAVGNMVGQRMRERHFKQMGKRILGLLTDLPKLGNA